MTQIERFRHGLAATECLVFMHEAALRVLAKQAEYEQLTGKKIEPWVGEGLPATIERNVEKLAALLPGIQDHEWSLGQDYDPFATDGCRLQVEKTLRAMLASAAQGLKPAEDAA